MCGDCPAPIGSQYCFCINRIVYTPAGGADCAAFDITLDPPHCATGLCGAYPNIFHMTNLSDSVYDLGGGLSLTVFGGFSGADVTCNDLVAPPYYRLFLDLYAEVTGCSLMSAISEIIADTSVGDECDLDSLLGSYHNTFLFLPNGDSLEVYSSFSKGGTCPPTAPIGDGLITEDANFMITEGGDFLILE